MAASPQEGLLKVSNSNSKTYQPLERSRPTAFHAKYVRNGWLVELLFVLLGIVALIALCVLLKKYDGKAAPRVNAVGDVNITLNTIVSILSTISRPLCCSLFPKVLASRSGLGSWIDKSPWKIWMSLTRLAAALGVD